MEAKDPQQAATVREVRMTEWALVGDRPVVLAQGDRDPFGSAPAIAAALAGAALAATALVSVSGADHSLLARAGSAALVDQQLIAAAQAAVRLV